MRRNIQFTDKNGNNVEVPEYIRNRCSHLLQRKRINLSTILTTIFILIIFSISIYEIYSIKQDSVMNNYTIPEYLAYHAPTFEAPYISTEAAVKEDITFIPEGLDSYLMDVIEEECNVNSIPKEFILAVMKTETHGFNTDCVSYNTDGSYDIGIMQINSGSMKELSIRYNLPEFMNNPKDPVNNIKLGIRNLAEYWDAYAESYDDTIQVLLATAGAYNRGASNQNKYKNVYEYNARVYAHYCNIINGVDKNISYAAEIPQIKEYLKSSYKL